MSEAQNSDSGNGNVNQSQNVGVNATLSDFDVSAEIQKLQDQAEKFKNDYLYLRAEFENYKKHAIRERSDLSKYGAERLARDFLGVLDNFERALATSVSAENLQTFRQGVEMTASELRHVLQKHGVTEAPAEGHLFDPNLHEALTSEVTDKVPAGHVARVFQKAYRLHDKLLRPAQVVVAKKPE